MSEQRRSADSADGSYLSDRVFEGVRSIDAEDAERLKASYVASRTSAQPQASADSASLRDALDNSQSLLVMIDLVGPDSASWIKEDMRDLLTKQIVENRTSLSDPKRAEPQSSSMASDDPTASKEWNDGCDFAMTQLCKFLDVEPSSVSWDAATETVEGDVSAVIGNILRAKFGEDWGPQCQAESVKPHEAPEWLWYGEVGGKPIVTFGRWPKHGARWRYKLAEIQPTEHDNRSQATTRPQCGGES